MTGPEMISSYIFGFLGGIAGASLVLGLIAHFERNQRKRMYELFKRGMPR